MACEFVVAGDWEKAKKVVEDNGGTLNGDHDYGTFSGSGVQGEYRLMMGEPPDRTSYMVTITRKPLLVSCSYIERKVKEYFAAMEIPKAVVPKKSLWQKAKEKVRGLFR